MGVICKMGVYVFAQYKQGVFESEVEMDTRSANIWVSVSIELDLLCAICNSSENYFCDTSQALS